MTRKWKRILLPLFIFLLLGVSGVQAQIACPWITQGTVAAYLGGEVTVMVHVSHSGDGVCRFTQRQRSSLATLEVAVNHEHSRACPPSAPSITGVGSSAVECHSIRHGETVDIIAGKVRDTAFTIRLITRKWPGGGNSAAQRSSIVEQTAEEVAGNLF